MAFYQWLFHTPLGVLVLIFALMLICLLVAFLFEKRIRHTYVDRGPREQGHTAFTDAKDKVREKTDAIVDQTDTSIDRYLSPDDEAGGDGRDEGSGLLGALEGLWDSWDDIAEDDEETPPADDAKES